MSAKLPPSAYLKAIHMNSKQRNKDNERKFIIVFFFYSGLIASYPIMFEYLRSHGVMETIKTQWTDPVQPMEIQPYGSAQLCS